MKATCGILKSTKSVSIIANGSRGDIQPYIALALALKEKYSVRILTSAEHKSFVEDFDLEHVNVWKWDNDTEEASKIGSNIRSAISHGNAKAFYGSLNELNIMNAEEFVTSTVEDLNTNRPDLLLVGSLAQYFEFYAPLVLKIPAVRVSLQVFGYNEDYAPLGIPTLPNGAHLDTLMEMKIQRYDGWKHFDDAAVKLGLPPLKSVLSKEDFLQEMDQTIRGSPSHKQIICQSAIFRDILFPSAGENYIFTGPCVLDAGQQKENNSFFGGDETERIIDEFIDRDHGRKPVYCGWGSMLAKSAEDMVEFAVRSLMICGERGIVLGGYAGLSLDTLKRSTTDEKVIAYAEEHILFVEKVSHENLFPRVKCIVHHGGAGTTQAALRAGVPTIITPIFLDQFDHSYVVEKLGVGFGFSQQLQQVTAESLGEAIKSVVNDDDIALRSKEVASKICKGNGTFEARAEIDKVIENIK